MRPRTSRTNASGRIPKNLTFDPLIYKKAEAIIQRDKRPRPLSVMLEDLVEKEWDRQFGKPNGRQAA